MSKKTNADKIRIVTKWQNAGFVHELTCGNEKCRDVLKPEEVNGTVKLFCPSCDYMQEHIPDAVLESESWLDNPPRLGQRSDEEDKDD